MQPRWFVLERALAEEFGVPADGGEWRAQFMAGVGDELAQRRLAALPGTERAFDLAQHPGQGTGQAANLGAG